MSVMVFILSWIFIWHSYELQLYQSVDPVEVGNSSHSFDTFSRNPSKLWITSRKIDGSAIPSNSLQINNLTYILQKTRYFNQYLVPHTACIPFPLVFGTGTDTSTVITVSTKKRFHSNFTHFYLFLYWLYLLYYYYKSACSEYLQLLVIFVSLNIFFPHNK